jgi:hypothetical protein
MDIDKRRLIDAMAKSTARLATRFNIPGSEMDHMAVATVMGELLRREDPARLQDLYVAGLTLAQRLAELVGRDAVTAIEVAQFHQLPPVSEAPADYASARDRLLALKKNLSSLVGRSGYPAGPKGDLQDVISSLCQWEGELLKLPTPSDSKTTQAQDFKQILESSARAQGGVFENAQVVEVTRLIGGFSNVTNLFKLADKNDEIWDLVARASTDLPLGIEGRDIDCEYHLLRYLHQSETAISAAI